MVAGWPGDAALSSLGSWGQGRGLVSSACREGKLAPPVLDHLGVGGVSIHSGRETNLFTC